VAYSFCLPTFVQEVKGSLGSDLEEKDGVIIEGECGGESDEGNRHYKYDIMKE
jgi:hypothetical protein